jgi:hypothetical protein
MEELTSGSKLLERAFRLHRNRVPKASNLACLALASVRKGRFAEGRTLLDRARRLDRHCDLLQRVERELSSLMGAQGNQGSEPKSQ